MKWDEPGGVGGIAGIAAIAGIARDRKTKNLTAETRRRGEQISQAGVELGIPGIELCKPFRILVEAQGGGVQQIARIAKIG